MAGEYRPICRKVLINISEAGNLVGEVARLIDTDSKNAFHGEVNAP
jgi:hypothetical protein